jgi:hypothetical protein
MMMPRKGCAPQNLDEIVGVSVDEPTEEIPAETAEDVAHQPVRSTITMAMHIVMTASAKMPSSCKGRYGKVAVVQLTQEYTAQGKRPKMISDRARGVLRIVWQSAPQNMGRTPKCGFQRALAEAQRYAEELNNVRDVADAATLIAPGSA